MLVGARSAIRRAIEIVDTGCGIRPNSVKQSRRFHRGSDTVDIDLFAGGLGLGLAICAAWPSARPRLDFPSTVGRGTVSQVEVPLRQTPQIHPSAAPDEP